MVDGSKHCFEVVDRDCGARPFLINCVGPGLRNRDCVYRFLSLGTVVDGPKHCFEAANRDCGARPLPNQLGGGTKKVLWTFFARALNPKSEEEIETASTDFCLSAQWLMAQNTVLRWRIGIAEQGPS